jgi:hypothetical protein
MVGRLAWVGNCHALLGRAGKKVALRPLCTCHWSHNMTMEKPKTTHKMVRRISFMKVSFQWKKGSAG